MSGQPNFDIGSVFDVKGLVAVVTGGHTGIGVMITQALAQNGARVYVIGRREDKLARSADKNAGEIFDIPGDVTDVGSLKTAAAEVGKKEEHIDILVANSGVGGPSFDKSAKTADAISEQILSTDMNEAKKLLDTNVLGYFYTIGAFLKLLGKSPNNPQAITITSNAAFGRESMSGILYSMTKLMTVQMLATHLAETKVRVNSIAPGLYPSELTTGDSDELGQSAPPNPADMGIPVAPGIGRAGKGVEMAAAILFMCSRHNSYPHGSILLTDGGVLSHGMPGSY